MQNLREAAQQALEALRLSHPKPRPGEDDYTEQGWKEHDAAIYAIRSALSDTQDWDEVEALRESLHEHMAEIHRLRAAGRHALEALENVRHYDKENLYGLDDDITALRAELAEATSQESRQVEPVAVWELHESGWEIICDGDWVKELPLGTKLYTTPPKREPLTDEEIIGGEE